MDYVTLGGYTQNIDRKFYIDGEEFELIGWNVKRFAELLNKSNPSMIEFLNSDITYYELSPYWMLEGEKIYEPTDEQLKDARLMRVNTVNVSGNLKILQDHANQEFKPISLFYHYRSMAKDNYQKYIVNRNDLSIKRHLYILRGLTYARYVEKTHRMPPLDYTEFYENELKEMKEEGTIPEMVYTYIGEFIRAKKNGEGSREIGDQELWNWIGDELDEHLDNEEHDIRGIDKERVNQLIKQVVP